MSADWREPRQRNNPKEPLNKSSVERVAGKIGMIARRATKVVARSTKPRSATQQAPDFAATLRDGALQAVCGVRLVAKGMAIRVLAFRASHPAKLPSRPRGTCLAVP